MSSADVVNYLLECIPNCVINAIIWLYLTLIHNPSPFTLNREKFDQNEAFIAKIKNNPRTPMTYKRNHMHISPEFMKLEEYEADLELSILPVGSWVLDLSYDDDRFAVYAANKYPNLNFVFFTVNPQYISTKLAKNLHVFKMSMKQFVKRSHKDYESFIINNKVGYRRIFASQGTECFANLPVIYAHLDKCMYKNYGNTIKSYFLFYKISTNKYPAMLISDHWLFSDLFSDRALTNECFPARFSEHLKSVSIKKIDYKSCQLEQSINRWLKYVQSLLLRTELLIIKQLFETGILYVSKHVLHPVSDFC